MQKYMHQMTEYITDVFHLKAMPCILEQGAWQRPGWILSFVFYFILLWLLSVTPSLHHGFDCLHV